MSSQMSLKISVFQIDSDISAQKGTKNILVILSGLDRWITTELKERVSVVAKSIND